MVRNSLIAASVSVLALVSSYAPALASCCEAGLDCCAGMACCF
ncbi:hypothetical protein [Aquibium sp. ELW1220]|nr:hypothetical protein [Aquibium sp. ELW1220]MDN2581998.1 hypothetical protein [Aquibium sp. ELW1220]